MSSPPAPPSPVAPHAPVGADASAAFWRTLLGASVSAPPPAAAGDLAILADRLCRRVAPGWAASLLAPLAAASGLALVAPGPARQSALFSSLARAAQIGALKRLTDAGLRPVAMKGFAAAHLLYPEPTPRIVGDLDVLIERARLRDAIALFAADGFAFGGARERRWGFVSDASFLPFHGPDGVCNIDFHVEPDAWPLHAGLPAAAVRDAAREVAAGGARFLAPADEHVVLIAVSNIAKDRFAWQTLSKAIDLSRLLRRSTATLDWDEIAARANAARLEKALAATLTLLADLGLDAVAIPPAVARRPTGMAGATYARVLADWRQMFPSDPGGGAMLWREATLAHRPSTALRLNARRLRGLLSPGDGVPPEARGLIPTTPDPAG